MPLPKALRVYKTAEGTFLVAREGSRFNPRLIVSSIKRIGDWDRINTIHGYIKEGLTDAMARRILEKYGRDHFSESDIRRAVGFTGSRIVFETMHDSVRDIERIPLIKDGRKPRVGTRFKKTRIGPE